MLGWAITFLIVAPIAAVLGFGGMAGVAVEAAKLVFLVAVILFAIRRSLAWCAGDRRPCRKRSVQATEIVALAPRGYPPRGLYFWTTAAAIDRREVS